jgi:hypothetical protein
LTSVASGDDRSTPGAPAATACSADRKPRALWNRFSGSFASAVSTSPSIAGGNGCCTTLLGGRGASSQIRSAIISADPVNGARQ